MQTVQGGCNCGAVRYEGEVDPRGVTLCHCHMCRRSVSGPLMSVRMRGGVRLLQQDGLTWWHGSEFAKRGFCATCGSQLFWGMTDAPFGAWTVSAGSLDDTLELGVFEHLFTDRAASWEALTEGVPHRTEADCLAELTEYLATREA